MAKIKNKEQYDWVVSRVEFLLPLVKEDAPLSDPSRIELELLSELAAEYSDENYSLGEPSLKDVLKLRMYELGVTQRTLAELIGVKNRLNEYSDLDCETEIDYMNVDTVLKEERRKSIEFLKKALNN